MDNLDIAIHLLQEAKKNRDKLEAYKYELQLGYDGDELYALSRRYTPTPTAVSYTHLDVYKRQHLQAAILAELRHHLFGEDA